MGALTVPAAADAAQAADEPELAPERVAELVSAGQAELVDVRTAAEHQAGRAPGARHVPLERLAEEADSLDASRAIVFYCRSGGRSAMATEASRASGRRAYTMKGGLVAWAERELPLEPDDGRVADRSGLPE